MSIFDKGDNNFLDNYKRAIIDATSSSEKIRGAHSPANIDSVDSESTLARNRHEIERQKHELARYAQNTKARSNLTIWASSVVSVWLVLVAGILFSQFKISEDGLDDKVLIALLTTTTLNILGLMYIVLKGYFFVSGKYSDAGVSNSEVEEL